VNYTKAGGRSTITSRAEKQRVSAPRLRPPLPNGFPRISREAIEKLLVKEKGSSVT
jgi:hypothetical protein